MLVAHVKLELCVFLNIIEWSPLQQEPEAPYNKATSRELWLIPLPA